MENMIRLAGPNRAIELFGIRLAGVSVETGKKFFFTLSFILIGLLMTRLARIVMWSLLRGRGYERPIFWTRQGIKVGSALLLTVGFISIWFDEPGRLTTALGLFTAGLAFALQKVVSAIAGYVVILHGKIFNVGDRITMGGVRGDVIALDFTRTTLMEMGQPPAVQGADPAIWVKSREFTGRVVTVSNSKIFDEPVYNYTQEFPYLWEEMSLPVSYRADRKAVERILLEAAREHSADLSRESKEVLVEMRRRYFMRSPSTEPKVYYRMTDNWLELTVRFVVREHGVREVKDAMYRQVLDNLERVGIGVASTTLEIIGMPSLRLERTESKSPQKRAV